MIKQRSNLVLPKSLYAIGNSKDELNLHTGELTHRIRKIVFDGTENWKASSSVSGAMWLSDLPIDYYRQFRQLVCICSHYKSKPCDSNLTNLLNNEMTLYAPQTQIQAQYHETYFRDTRFTNATDWKQFLSDEYTNGTPVTIWYVLAEPTTETITISEDVSGIVEGYLIQDGTPTPTNPIYPTSCDSVDMWNEIMYRQYGVNETLSPIPTTVFSQGDGIDSCTVYGNTVQNGTPTPTDPVDVSGVGDFRNLFDYSSSQIGAIDTTTGADVDYNNARRSTYMSVNVGDIITISGQGGNIRIFEYDINSNYLDINFLYEDSFTIEMTGFIRIVGGLDTVIDTIMINKGPIALSYEPYGYVVPIEVDDTKITVPLNTTQSIRQIQKLVLTGDETWTYLTGGKFWIPARGYMKNGMITVCTHYIGTTNASGSSAFSNGTIGFYNTNNRLIICDTSFNNETTFKQYLQQQYQAGTPVTVYYVLAEPQTTTLNEPLMKIGDYADSVTYSSNIPTTYGQKYTRIIVGY